MMGSIDVSKAETSMGERISRVAEAVQEIDGGEGNETGGSPGRRDALVSMERRQDLWMVVGDG
jgi:hypothetical protein